MGDRATPSPRTIAAWTVRGIGIALGAGLALMYMYLYLIWESPPPIDWPRARLKTMVGLYVLTRALLFAGPFRLLGRIARLIAPSGYNGKKRQGG